MKITKQIFDEPAGTVRGSVILMMTIGKKEKRIGFCLLLVGKPNEVTLDVPKGKMTPAEVTLLSEGLAKFAAEVANA
jgi:hypothetical protein